LNNSNSLINKKENQNLDSKIRNTIETQQNSENLSFMEIKIRKPNKTSSNMKVNYLPNENIDLSSIEKFETHKKCNKRTGLVYLLKNSEKLPHELDLLPVYGNLNLDKFKFSLNEQEKSVFFSINLIDILRISQKEILKNQNCFNILLNHVDSQTLLKGPITLCFKSNYTMDSWMKTILEFKQCLYDISNGPKENKVLVDFGKVNKLLKDKNDAANVNGKDLYYDNTNKAIVKNDATSQKENQIKNIMHKIVQTITTGNIQTNLIKRKMANRLKRTKKAAEELQKKEELVRDIVNKRLEKEQEKKNEMVNVEHKNKEIQLLKAVKDRIVELKKTETKQYHKQLKKQIKLQKEIANRQSQSMIRYLINKSSSTVTSSEMGSSSPSGKSNSSPSGKSKSGRIISSPLVGINSAFDKINSSASVSMNSYAYDIIKSKKLTPYDNCTDNRILNFKDMIYIRNTCDIYYGENVKLLIYFL